MSDNKNCTLKKIDSHITKLANETLKNAELFNQPTTPTLNITPPSYETTMLKKLADDIKQPLERQIDSVQSIADSAKRQADSLEDRVRIAREEADSAKRQADSLKERVRIAGEEADSAKRQADSLEKQVDSVESIAKSADKLAEDSKEIAESAKTSSDIALKESKKADIKGWISIFIAAFGGFIEFAIHHAQVIGFIKSILGV